MIQEKAEKCVPLELTFFEICTKYFLKRYGESNFPCVEKDRRTVRKKHFSKKENVTWQLTETGLQRDILWSQTSGAGTIPESFFNLRVWLNWQSIRLLTGGLQVQILSLSPYGSVTQLVESRLLTGETRVRFLPFPPEAAAETLVSSYSVLYHVNPNVIIRSFSQRRTIAV